MLKYLLIIYCWIVIVYYVLLTVGTYIKYIGRQLLWCVCVFDQNWPGLIPRCIFFGVVIVSLNKKQETLLILFFFCFVCASMCVHTHLCKRLCVCVCSRCNNILIYRILYCFKQSVHRYEIKPYQYIAYHDISTYRGLY